jgi:DNA-binding transcriptional ArsR family regulator
MDAVFKALADPLRRIILDRLLQQGGLSMSQLCEGHEISRFGVMKHVRVLEQAGLIITRKSGRETLHYLNVLPIQEVLNRWLGRYEHAISSSMLDLKSQLETQSSQINTQPKRKRHAL